MRINLMWGNGSPLSGYTNVDPHSYDKEGVINSDITDLNDIVGDSEATEILVADVIDYLPKEIVAKAIGHWVTKLRHKGKIVMMALELLNPVPSQFEWLFRSRHQHDVRLPSRGHL